MGLFDSLVSTAEGALGGGSARQALAGALESCSPGGVTGLLGKLEQSGLGETIAIWLPGGDQTPISVEQLRAALGDEHIQSVAGACGISTDELLSHLSRRLPALAAQRQAAG